MYQSIITPLYVANYFVDQVQDAKNKFVKDFIHDEKTKEALTSFVEAQRTFTKEVNKTANQLFDHSMATAREAAEKLQKSLKV